MITKEHIRWNVGNIATLTAPSGWEEEAASYVIDEAKDMGRISIGRDPLGSVLISVKGARRPAKPIVLTAHLDEMGVMVEDITKEGLLKFGVVGNVARRTLLGRVVTVGEWGRMCHGVIGLKPIHLTSQEERKTLPKLEDLYIDIGSKGEPQTETMVQRGDPGVFAPEMPEMTEMGNQLHHKAMSRSLSCAVLLELLNMKEQLPVDVTMAFTVQRHVGNRGAYSAAAALDDGIAISLDLCPGDTVGDDLPHLGKGPVVPSMDQKAIFDPELTEKLAAAARACGIPIQRWAKAECDGDGGVFQRSGKGFSAAALYCPAKYTDAPAQNICLEDAENMARLLVAFLEECAE